MAWPGSSRWVAIQAHPLRAQPQPPNYNHAPHSLESKHLKTELKIKQIFGQFIHNLNIHPSHSLKGKHILQASLSPQNQNKVNVDTNSKSIVYQN